MAIFIDWGTKIIHVPQADLTLVGPSTYQLDLNDFRLALKDLEDDEEGMAFLLTHNHVPPLTLAGIQFARIIEIVNGYTVEFEDGQYGVNVVGGNSNIPDVLVRNQVSVNTANSAGLVFATGINEATVQSAMTAQGYTPTRATSLDALDMNLSDVAEAVWARVVDGTITARQSMMIMNAVLSGKVSGAGSGTEVFRNPADTKDRLSVTVDASGNRTGVVRDLT